MRNYYVKGTNNAWCQLCAKKMKASQLKPRYDGVICCPKCWNPKHPQEYAPVIRQDIPVSLSSPPPPELTYPGCELWHTQAIPGYAYPGCMIPARNYLNTGLLNPDSLPGTNESGSGLVFQETQNDVEP